MVAVKWVPPQDWSPEKLEKAKVLARRTGSLRHYMNCKQREIYDLFWREDVKSSASYLSRKNGKSFVGFLLALEFARKHPGTITRYMCDTTKQAKDVVYDIYNQCRNILPEEFIPRQVKSENKFVFEFNGSEIVVGGTSRENIESSRGPRCDLLIDDEIASWDDGDDYYYAMRSVLLPQMTVSKFKKRLDLTTPPKNPAHVWMVEDYRRYLDEGTVVSWDIDENPMLSDAEIEELIVEHYNGDRNNPDFLREHKLKLIPESSRAVIPECTSNLGATPYLIDVAPWCESVFGGLFGYIVVDWGGINDNLAIGGFLYAPSESKLVAVEEITLGNVSMEEFVEKYWEMVTKLRAYRVEPEIHTIVDCMADTRKNLRDIYGLDFRSPLKKRHKTDSVEVFRNRLTKGQFLVSDKLRRLRSEMEYGMWKETVGDTNTFERSAALGHLDHLDTAIYAVLFVPWGQTPGKNTNERVSFGNKKRR